MEKCCFGGRCFARVEVEFKHFFSIQGRYCPANCWAVRIRLVFYHVTEMSIDNLQH